MVTPPLNIFRAAGSGRAALAATEAAPSSTRRRVIFMGFSSMGSYL
jgi:hypothetical protein